MNDQTQRSLIFNKGDIIFSQNDTPSDTLYDIHYGSVTLYDGYGTDNEVRLATLGVDHFFGEIDMIAGQPRSFTAVAGEKNTRISVIDKDTFRTYFSSRPFKLLQIMKNLDSRIEGQARQYIRLCSTIYDTYKKNPDELNNLSLEMQPPIPAKSASLQAIDGSEGSISIQNLAPGETLFRQGELGTVMYEVVSGEIILSADIGSDQPATLSTLTQGQCLGVSGIVNIRPRAATAIAGAQGAVVKVINASAFDCYFQENEDKIMEIMRHMAMMLRDMNASYARLRSSAEAKKLTELAPPTGMRAVLLKVAAVWQNAVH